MATPSQTTPAAASRRESPRIQLARLASAAALAEPGITGLDGGAAGQHTTFAGTERLPGVLVIADAGSGSAGAYGVALYVTAAPSDLHELSAAVEAAVRGAAAEAGLDTAISTLHITFTDLTLTEEATPT